MDIVDFAMNMELDGKAFYEKQAAQATLPELKEILLNLAEEEEKHYQFFRRIKENPSDFPNIRTFFGPQNLSLVKNIFEEMSSNPVLQAFDQDVVLAWTQALRIEERAVAFYREKANQEKDADRRDLLVKIGQEEERHVHMIDAVLMYLKHPAAFAESAEFMNFRSLEGW